MEFNLSAFKEPRGVMRVLQFIFSICAFATITAYSGYMIFKCGAERKVENFSYPYNLLRINMEIGPNCNKTINADFSSDAKFFVATGVLAMLYSLAISITYLKFDDMYKSNNRLPLIDFCITVIFGILWLSSSAAWAHALSGLKSATDVDLSNCGICSMSTSSFSTLNISVIFGFLNFFLWAADLWFLYKETVWFQANQPQTTSGV